MRPQKSGSQPTKMPAAFQPGRRRRSSARRRARGSRPAGTASIPRPRRIARPPRRGPRPRAESGLCRMASAISVSSFAIGERLPAQPSMTASGGSDRRRPSAPGPRGPAAPAACTRQGAGGALSATQAASVPSSSTTTSLPCVRMGSVQLHDQVIRVGADSQNHLAQDVDRMQTLRVDRRAVPAAPEARNSSRSRSSTSNFTAKRFGGCASTPVIGIVPLAGSWPTPCAQITESTRALMMRPG